MSLVLLLGWGVGGGGFAQSASSTAAAQFETVNPAASFALLSEKIAVKRAEQSSTIPCECCCNTR